MRVSPWWIVVAALGWSTAILFFGWYRIERWRADAMTKLYRGAIENWDEARRTLWAALLPGSVKPAEKEFKS